MSLSSSITHSRRAHQGAFAALAIGGLLLTSTAFIPASGAWFSDAKTGTITTSSGSLILAAVGDDGSFDAQFSSLAPGSYAQKTYTVKNNGTLTGRGELRIDPLAVSGGANPNVQFLHYSVNVDGTSSTLDAGGGTLGLGVMGAGETRTITVTVQLDGDAGNEWEGVTLTNAITVSLLQIQ